MVGFTNRIGGMLGENSGTLGKVWELISKVARWHISKLKYPCTTSIESPIMSYICQKQENSNAKWHNKEETQKWKSLANL